MRQRARFGQRPATGAAAIYDFFLELIGETFRLQESENEWWDDARSPDVKETRDAIFVRAFRQAMEDCIDRMGKKIGKWEWGTIHQAEFRSSTLGESGIGLIERVFNRGPVAASGGSATVNVARWKLEDPFTVVHIPAMREIIDLADIGSGWMMHAPGQSGHPRNRHYDDSIEPWRDVEYHPTLWERADVLSNRQGRLLLEPAR